jgi:hypothetical protein
MSASGVPYATWDGGQYVVRVDLEPDDAREIASALGHQDAASAMFHAAADRVEELRSPHGAA